MSKATVETTATSISYSTMMYVCQRLQLRYIVSYYSSSMSRLMLLYIVKTTATLFRIVTYMYVKTTATAVPGISYSSFARLTAAVLTQRHRPIQTSRDAQHGTPKIIRSTK